MPRLLYIVFDRFPAPKGAAVHIAAFARALGKAFGPVELITLANDPTAALANPTPVSSLPGVTHTPLAAPGPTVIDRAMAFRAQFGAWRRGRKFPAVHFRSIFEGYPIARHKSQVCDQLVFEVNGLPSIELKYHYPAVANDRDLIDKIISQEQCCLEAADLLVTVSEVTAAHLRARGAEASRIRVIPNGVDLSIFTHRLPRPLEGTCRRASDLPPPPGWSRDLPEAPAPAPDTGAIRLLYSGTLAAWQGVDRAVEALALLRRDFEATLTLVGPASRTRKEELLSLADTVGARAQVRLLDPLPQESLARLYHEHDIALVPLLRNDRNTVQGCCPLKLLEAMAAGTPVIASDLPVVRELAESERDALLVRPGSGKAIKDAVLRLIEDPTLGGRLSATARASVEARFSWSRAGAALVEAYRERRIL